MADKKSTFEILNNLDVGKHKKTIPSNNGKDLTYLSWTWAWTEFMKVYPEATYEIIKFDGKPYAYDENLGYMVYTTVTVEGLTHEMWLPVMDGANRAMKAYPYTVTNKWGKEQTVQAATMFDINTALMRCLTKNLAMFGLGLYIYAGEDLPEAVREEQNEEKRLEAIARLKKVGSKEQIEFFEKKRVGKPVDEFTFEQADGAIKQIEAKKREGKNDRSTGGS